MKTRSMTLLCMSILVLFLAIGSVSAATSFSISDSTLTFTEKDSLTFEITNLNDTEQLVIDFDALSIDGFDLEVSIADNNKTLDKSESRTMTVELKGSDDEIRNELNFLSSTSGTFLIMNDSNHSDNETVTVTIKNEEFCDYSDNSDLKIDNLEFDNEGEFGSDDEWLPLETIEVSFDLENDANEDIENIDIEWALYDSDGEEIMSDEVDSDEYDEDLDEDDDMSVSFKFTLDENIDELKDGKYTFFISATGEVQEDDEYDTCTSDSEEVDIIITDDLVVLSEVEIQETASCGETIILTADVWNIGDDKQKDVVVEIYSSLLGLEETIDMDTIDSLEKEELRMELQIPEDAEEKRYKIEIRIYDDDEEYEYDNEESIFIMYLTVDSCVVKKNVEVSAVAKSGGVSGKESEIELTIVNTGEEDSIFSLRALNYESWADTAEFNEETFTLGAGDSKTILTTLDVKKDAIGENMFNVEISSNGEIVEMTPVTLEIEARSGFSLSKIFGGISFSTIAIIIVNLILLAAIIIVVVKIIKKN